MADEKKDEVKLIKYVKDDGKTVVEINDNPANIEKAKELGWKKK